MRLSKITQRSAYAAVRRASDTAQRETTMTMLERTRATLADDFKVHLTCENVWLGLRDRDIPRKMRDFLWKVVHGAHRLGTYWTNIPGYEQRALCGTCGIEDTMEHILFECSAPGQAVVWNMVKAAIEQTGCDVPRLSIGAVMGVASIVLMKGGKTQKGPSRMVKIMVVEGAHLIWRMRCERVIEWEDAPDKSRSTNEVRMRYWAAVNKRMELDRSLVYTRVTGRKPKKKVVLETWRSVLAGREDLPQDWSEVPGVLVGTLGQPRPTGVG
ncbi:hypothetical protein K466DRAFT_573408 [Polyporus arcularius HHB13444]|uniref:Reverse transcriptase zinc-binding domain-containing protein n=1 Tax=Polyporus arcularius HHB13444 TaxID=1314778 RepID=A0A5C3PQ15_9APHY|nr:hypothetical protein K466DRAFT_573408 [Polyporus arcularius HHB13444]